ncbi:MAG: biopolymer transporter ExbD [Polyangiaceae bacterium]|nr:biopolymer transporter ExbD [Polyangiaceae bacterium]
MKTRSLLVLAAALHAFGCDDPPPKKNPFEPPAKSTNEPPKLTEPPKPKGPPELEVKTSEIRVGFDLVLFDRPEGPSRLTTALAEHRSHLEGKQVTLAADRKAKPAWVIALMKELEKLGATGFLVKTESRTEFPKELALDRQATQREAKPCAVVAMVLDDRATAVWQVQGGAALKWPKGFAGPDLSMTAETLEKKGAACKDSAVLFFQGGEKIEWGLIYDLAASATKLQKHKFEKLVLLEKVPVAGRKVEL